MGKQPVQGQKKTKDQIAKAAASSSKGGRKKWTKGRIKDKVINAVFFDKPLFDKLLQEATRMKLITVSTLMDKLKITGSLARKGIKFLREKELIKACGEQHHSQYVYTTTAVPKKTEDKAEEKDKPQKGKGQKKGKAAAAAAEEENIRKTHETLQAYAEARILKKQGKLPPKRDYYNRSKTQSQMRLQRNIAIGMVLALLTSPFIGKKVATDDDFRRQYVPTWLLPLPLRERDAAFYNNNNHNPNHTNTNNGGDDDSTTTTRSSTSEITREELHERMAQLQHDLHVRALRGDFAPEKLQTLREKRARSRLSKADMDLAEKYNWGRLHPEEDDDDDNDA
jgi:small subunit ribosomal protein S25e